jgi:RNA polymerase sigma-70 factor, ECF subfamily
LDHAETVAVQRQVPLLALDDTLAQLEAVDPRQSRIVELRYFGGLSIEETAALMGVSEGTVGRE